MFWVSFYYENVVDSVIQSLQTEINEEIRLSSGGINVVLNEFRTTSGLTHQQVKLKTDLFSFTDKLSERFQQ